MEMLLTCNERWLDNAAVPTGSTTMPMITTGNPWYGGGNGYYQYPHYYTYYHYPVLSSGARPIKLTMGEVERLRNVARDDPKLKEILKKFTSQIEITVNFE